ncbi:hypothetical protein L6452_37846 [Arctium lappa]|uniref:Uncharacterized protein n=1 Tax=Arctium lappa TaxID=4217 RepID=A0ACB8Y462_ARCLA|nr:hypothetical protein L6452_37846 [Arctium lappa]
MGKIKRLYRLDLKRSSCIIHKGLVLDSVKSLTGDGDVYNLISSIFDLPTSRHLHAEPSFLLSPDFSFDFSPDSLRDLLASRSRVECNVNGIVLSCIFRSVEPGCCSSNPCYLLCVFVASCGLVLGLEATIGSRPFGPGDIWS